jgi:hypothetical protein
MVRIPHTSFEFFLPKHFTVQENPPGVVHAASGTFVIIVKVPDTKRMNVQKEIPRSFFENPGYTLLSLKEEDAWLKMKRSQCRMYCMKYAVQGHEFERYTAVIDTGEGQFLVIGNYATKLKNQVHEEVEKIMASIKTR